MTCKICVCVCVCVINITKAVLWYQKKWNWISSKSWMRNSRQVTTYADINRLAFLQSSRDCCINKLMCIIQIIHHCLKRHHHRFHQVKNRSFMIKTKNFKRKFYLQITWLHVTVWKHWSSWVKSGKPIVWWRILFVP